MDRMHYDLHDQLDIDLDITSFCQYESYLFAGARYTTNTQLVIYNLCVWDQQQSNMQK